jgi:hypothetical protein
MDAARLHRDYCQNDRSERGYVTPHTLQAMPGQGARSGCLLGDADLRYFAIRFLDGESVAADVWLSLMSFVLSCESGTLC